MVDSITVMVHGGSDRKRAPQTLLGAHLAGLLFASGAAGAATGAAGAFLPLDAPQRAWLSVLALVLLAAHELGVIRLPLPRISRQVPNDWRRRFRPAVAAFLYGAGLGAGVGTRVPFATLYGVLALSLLFGSPLAGAMIMAGFGLGRGLATAGLVARQLRSGDFHERLAAKLDLFISPLHAAAGATLVVTAVVVSLEAWRLL